jgi:hypothetical protein
MQTRRVSCVALALVLALGCRKGSERASADLRLRDEPPPTEAEATAEVRGLIEKAAKDGIHMRFWRIGAGAPGPDGWVSAAPTRGGFAIELPAPFNDFMQRAKATDGVIIEATFVGARWEGGTLACTWMHRVDGSPSPVPARPLREEEAEKPDTLFARDRTWEGYPAVEVESRSPEAHSLTMIVDASTGGRFTVVAELPEGAFATHRAEVDRFVHSLKTKTPPPGR